MSRDWGPWTIIKLETLEKYFSAFTTASKFKAPKTLYLDLFGGRPDNRERDTGRLFKGSAVRAAEAVPAFSHLIVTELDDHAADEQRQRLEVSAPGRVTVVAGDCNEKMAQALEDLAGRDQDYRFAPTFALLDQYSAEITWLTLRMLSTFKSSKAKTKVELCMYFGPSFIVRGLHGPEEGVNPAYAQRLDAMFGSPEGWRMILAARDDGVLSPAAAQNELVNLMRWQLEHQLGYSTTLPLQVRNTVGHVIFLLIFATDHAVGDKIMRQLFEGATTAFDSMVQRAKWGRKLGREAESGEPSLFSADEAMAMDSGPGDVAHPTTFPPLPPYRYKRLWDRDKS